MQDLAESFEYSTDCDSSRTMIAQEHDSSAKHTIFSDIARFQISAFQEPQFFQQFDISMAEWFSACIEAELINAKEACQLDQIVPQSKQTSTLPFLYTSKPRYTLLAYVSRIMKYLEIKESIIVSALHYIRRFLTFVDVHHPKLSLHKIAGVCIVLAYQYHEDFSEEDLFCAKVLGIDKEYLVDLQFFIMEHLDYKLEVSEDIFMKYMNEIARICIQITFNQKLMQNDEMIEETREYQKSSTIVTEPRKISYSN